jgi:hypothetical protein
MYRTYFASKHKHLGILLRKFPRRQTPLGKPYAYRENSDLLQMKLRLVRHLLNNNQVMRQVDMNISI